MEEEKLLKRKKRAKAEKNTELLANTLEKLGVLYQAEERYDEALEAYEEEKVLLQKMGKSMQAAIASRWMGELYSLKGLYKDALKELKDYFEVATAEENLVEEQRALATIGRTYYLMAECISGSDKIERKRALKEARQAYLLSLKVCDKIKNINRYELMQMRSRLLQNMGLVFEAQGDFGKAVEHLEEAIGINKGVNLTGDLFSCYISLASLYQKQGNSSVSLKYHDLALEIGEKLPDKTFLQEALCSKADVYFSVANHRAAKQTLIKAFRIYGISSEAKSVIEKNLKIAHVLCEFKDKLTKIQSEKKLEDGDLNAMKQLNEQMGDAWCAVKNFKEAITYYLKMFECCEALGYCGKDLVPALFSLSQTYRDAGLYDKSLKYLQKELEIWEDNPEEACKTSLNIVKILELKGCEYCIVMDGMKKAYDYALISRSEKLEIKVLKNMLRIQEKYGYTDVANETKDKLEIVKGDSSSLEYSSDASDEDEEVATPDFINDISLSDVLDENELGSGDVSRPRQVRRFPQSLKIRRNEKGETQLQVACIAGNYQLVKQLIDLKHPVNVTDNGGWTPLHEVCNLGHEELVDLLLDHGANINDPGGDGSEGVTPLHDACSNGHLQIVQTLLDRGACMDVRTNDNKTPLDFLMDWASRADSLTKDNRPLFESVKERLTKGLERAGLINDNIAMPEAQCNEVKKAAKIISKNSLKTNNAREVHCRDTNRKRYRSVIHTDSSSSDSMDEENSDHEHNVGNEVSEEDNGKCNEGTKGVKSFAFSKPLIEDATVEYQRVMEGLRKKVYQVPSRKCEKTIGALIGEDDIVDDWLIDDLKDPNRPSKKRKIQEFNKGGAKLIGTLRSDVMVSVDDSFGSYDSNHEDQLVESEESDADFNEEFHCVDRNVTYQSGDKRKADARQSSLLDSGFFPVLPDQINKKNNTMQPVVSDNEGFIRCVKVHIENISLVVPLYSNDSSSPLTINWLAKEAAKRFLKLVGREPILVLLTKDGATLTSDDPVSIITDKELKSHVIGWKSVSLTQRYIDACAALNCKCIQLIQDSLEKCDANHTLNLSSCGLYSDNLSPIIRALQYEYSLKELILGGNALMFDGIQMLSSIKGLPLLEVLDLSCNNITSRSLATLHNFLVQCKCLKVLDLSYNDFEDGWLEILHKIVDDLKYLRSLNIRSCDMNGDEFNSWNGTCPPLSNISFLETLDISYNPLGKHGVNGFLCFLNTTLVHKLCVAGTTIKNTESVIPEILKFFRRGSPVNLRCIDLSDTFISDSELLELLEYLAVAEQLTTLILQNNDSLTGLSFCALTRRPKVPKELDLSGNDNLFASCDEENYCDFFNDLFLKQLSSLSITCPRTEVKKTCIYLSEKLKENWKQLWGDSAEILIGPCGLLKLSHEKSEIE